MVVMRRKRKGRGDAGEHRMVKFVRVILVNTVFDFERYMPSAGTTLYMPYASDLQLGFPVFDALYFQ